VERLAEAIEELHGALGQPHTKMTYRARRRLTGIAAGYALR
jgi:hypothetical protein